MLIYVGKTKTTTNTEALLDTSMEVDLKINTKKILQLYLNISSPE
jgi:hypothetical protein